MRTARLWRDLLKVEKTVVDGVRFDESGALLVAVHPTRSGQGRCGRCGRRSPGYDTGGGRRRWRSLDFGSVPVFLEADAARVTCQEHGVVVVAVPWARHGAWHTRAFDDQVAWLVTQTSKSTVQQFMRVAWDTVGAIVARVWADVEAATNRLAGVRRIGIDEVSYKKGHKYLTVVVDHDTRALIWAAPGRDKATVQRFFAELGPAGCAAISHVSADGAAYIADVVDAACPNAVRCADPFHVVKWAIEAMDTVRLESWNNARKLAAATEAKRGRGRPAKTAAPRPVSDLARQLKGCRVALWRNPENLSEQQAMKLDWLARTDPQVHRAYLLKEGLRTIFRLPYQAAVEALDKWLAWARRSRLPPFRKLARSITAHKASILAAIQHDLSNGLVESTNTKIRLLTRVAYGFKSPDSLVALALLTLGGHRPALPGR